MDEQRVIGRYQIKGLLGKGAMGCVYQAFDPNLKRLVAIKTIIANLRDDPNDSASFKDRFFREAHANSQLNHPNIVSVYDSDIHEGQPFIVMEYIPGNPLSKFLKPEHRTNQQTSLLLLEQMAAGLDYAHRKGVVHRDIKPANVLVTHDWELRIVDFGLARLQDSNLTTTGVFLGTPSYASPEQILGKPVEAPSDIFSFAIVAFEMLFGMRPFPGDNINSILYHIVNTQPDFSPIRLPNPALSRSVNEVFAKALTKDLSQRTPSAGKFVKDLRAALEHSGQAPNVDVKRTAPLPIPQFGEQVAGAQPSNQSGITSHSSMEATQALNSGYHLQSQPPASQQSASQQGPAWTNSQANSQISNQSMARASVPPTSHQSVPPPPTSSTPPPPASPNPSHTAQPVAGTSSSRGLLIILLMLFGCMIIAAVVGFFGWQWYQNRGQTGNEPPITQVLPDDLQQKDSDPPLIAEEQQLSPDSSNQLSESDEPPSDQSGNEPSELTQARESFLAAIEDEQVETARLALAELETLGEDASSQRKMLELLEAKLANDQAENDRREGDAARLSFQRRFNRMAESRSLAAMERIARDYRRQWPTDETGIASMKRSIAAEKERRALAESQVKNPPTDSSESAGPAPTEPTPTADEPVGDHQTDNLDDPANTSGPLDQPNADDATLIGAGGIKLVRVNAGSYKRGSRHPEFREDFELHDVTLSRDFYIGVHEITQAQWKMVMGNNPSRSKGDQLPVTNISWKQAREFTEKLNELEKVKLYRLPTEAEWEYACRAGKTSYFLTGNRLFQTDARFEKSNKNQPGPVGSHKPNAWGIYDMHGNVWEWCLDSYQGYPKGLAIDPQGPDGRIAHNFRVVRGGSFETPEEKCSCGYRTRRIHRLGNKNLGFRVVRMIP